jgi:hypothetical protein
MYTIILFIYLFFIGCPYESGGVGGAEGVARFVGLTPQLALVLVLGCECE